MKTQKKTKKKTPFRTSGHAKQNLRRYAQNNERTGKSSSDSVEPFSCCLALGELNYVDGLGKPGGYL